MNTVDSAGIVTLKSSVLSKLQRYFDTKYVVESRKESEIATLLDPRFNFSGFRSRETATLAKELLI